MLLRTPIDLGFAIRDRRRRLALDQAALAKRVGVSRKWISDIEQGKPGAAVGLILRTLDALGLRLTLDTEQASPSDDKTVAVAPVDIDKVLDRTRERS
jgi:HTH-type transcriptional regulator / antitoxin HipB